MEVWGQFLGSQRGSTWKEALKMNEEKGLRGDRGFRKGGGAMAGVQRAVELPLYGPAWLTARPRPEQCNGKNMGTRVRESCPHISALRRLL